MFFAGDFKGKSQLWLPYGEETPEGREIENMLIYLGLSQVTSEHTNFEPGKKTSCIDIIVTDQPNIVLYSETRASLDPFCHHQIIYCKANLTIPPPLPFKRKSWHFNRANTAGSKRSIRQKPRCTKAPQDKAPRGKIKITL